MGAAQRFRSRPGYNHGCFVTHVLRDLRPFLRGFADILLADASDPREFRNTVACLEAYAEHLSLIHI